MTKSNEMKAFRIRAGLTQAEMAKRMGCNINTYCNKENGKTPITTAEASEFCKAAGIDNPEIMAFIFLQ